MMQDFGCYLQIIENEHPVSSTPEVLLIFLTNSFSSSPIGSCEFPSACLLIIPQS